GSPWHLPGRVPPAAGSCRPFQMSARCSEAATTLISGPRWPPAVQRVVFPWTEAAGLDSGRAHTERGPAVCAVLWVTPLRACVQPAVRSLHRWPRSGPVQLSRVTARTVSYCHATEGHVEQTGIPAG
ncbi:hypothetical protein Celaphus_00010693, partial [Cervus elaphus hippelaphus]